jgi:hypothetical protein
MTEASHRCHLLRRGATVGTKNPASIADAGISSFTLVNVGSERNCLNTNLCNISSVPFAASVWLKYQLSPSYTSHFDTFM